MSQSAPSRKPAHPLMDDAEWARRRAGNVKLGLAFAGVAVLLFLLALWKYRPL